MAPFIAVVLLPADAASPQAQALVDACTLGARPHAECVLAPTANQDAALVLATVTWEGPERRLAHLEVDLGNGRPHRWRERDVAFTSQDAELERWRTVGFALATLASGLVAEEAPEAPKPPPPPEPQPERQPPPEGNARPATPRWWLDALFSAEVAADSPWGAGGAIRLSRRIDAERVFVAAGATCTVQRVDGDRLTIVRPGLSAELGVVALRLGDGWRVAVRVGANLELVQLGGTDPQSGISAHAARWRVGAAEGVEVSWMAFPSVGLVVSGHAAEASGAVDVRAHGGLLARLPAVDWTGQGGIRVAFP
jgi:hypothetical protein